MSLTLFDRHIDNKKLTLDIGKPMYDNGKLPFDNETLAFKSILDRDNGKPTFDNDKPTINKWQMDIGQEKTTQRK